MEKVKADKVAIIGCGFVGSASAFALMQNANMQHSATILLVINPFIFLSFLFYVLKIKISR